MQRQTVTPASNLKRDMSTSRGYASRPLAELLELPDSAFLITAEAALVMRISANALRQRRARDEAPVSYGTDKSIRYKLGDILQFVENGFSIEPRVAMND